MAAAEAIDEGKILKRALSTLIRNRLHLLVTIYSHDYFTGLLTKRDYIDKYVRADVNVIWYEYETSNADEVIWIPCKVNLTDPGTKAYSPINQAIKITICTSKISVELSTSEFRTAELTELSDMSIPKGEYYEIIWVL